MMKLWQNLLKSTNHLSVNIFMTKIFRRVLQGILTTCKSLIIIIPFFFLTLFLIFSGCSEEEIDLGYNIIPSEDIVTPKFIDSLDIEIFSVPDEKLRTENISTALFGSYKDPVFGYLRAEFVTQVRVSGNTTYFDNSPVADSVVLSFRYKFHSDEDSIPTDSVYGNPDEQIRLRVFEIIDDLRQKDNNSQIIPYYSDSEFSTKDNPIADTAIIRTDADTILRIRLNPEFGQRLINQGLLDDRIFKSNNHLFDFFKGIYIKTGQEMQDATILPFDLLSSDSQMTLYYHSADLDSAFHSYNFHINQHCGRANLFEHDYSAAGFDYPQKDWKNQKQDTLVYVQSGAGLKGVIHFPGLDKLKSNDKEILIVNAELYLTAAERPAGDSSPVEDEIVIYNPDYYKEENYQIRRGVKNISFIDSTSSYYFNIPEYVQQLIDDEIVEDALYVSTLNRAQDISRLILKTGQISENVKLILTYVELE